MLTLNLSEHDCLSESDAEALGAKFLDEGYFRVLLQEDADVFKPDGSCLLKFRKDVLSEAAGRAAWAALRGVPEQFANTNRGMAAGEIPESQEFLEGRRIVERSGTRAKVMRDDGTVSKTVYANPAPSGVAGYMDRNARYPYCRQTAFSLENPDKWATALPYIQEVNEVLRREAPERWEAQHAAIERTHPDFKIHGTVFTTLTVNKNWQTAVHKDAGDYRPGFGVMTVLEAGQPYEGAYLCFPQFRVAVDMRSRDVLLADVHEFHGNTPFRRCVPGTYERVSLVMYYREKMLRCGSADEELERAKHRKAGDPINDPIA
jgi:hypothetical protein